MNELLPIGSVVKINGSPSYLMIIGHGPISSEEQTHYDYLAINYPFGLGDSMDSIMLDRDFIESVLHKGYADEEAEVYYRAVDKIIKKI